MENIVINPKNPKHFYQVKRSENRVRVYLGSILLADTKNALLLKELGNEIYDGIYYIPREDISNKYLTSSTHTTYCPLKGTANYFDLTW